MKLSKLIPLNFHVLSWRFSQWVCTLSFLATIWLCKSQVFGYMGDMAVRYFTPLGFVAAVAIIALQGYAYGAYVGKSISIVYIPAIIVSVCFVVDVILAFIMRNLGYTAYWDQYFYRYGLLLFQNAIMLWVWFDVETIEVPESMLTENMSFFEDK